MSKLKIYYDFQIMHMQQYGGISRYFYDMICSIESQKLADVKTDCLFNINEYFAEKGDKHFFMKKEPIRGGAFLNRRNTFHHLRKGYDIIHPTYYDPYILKANTGKIVITIYDMIHERFPELFPSDDCTVEYKKKMIYESDHIIAISQSTKNDILQIYPDIAESKISVIYLASNFSERIYDEKKVFSQKKYVLFVGRRDKYKNFIAFFEGVKKLLIEDEELNLICAGGGSFTAEEKELIGSLSKQVQQLDVNDEKLYLLYSNAICFVFPSLYEGFGIPTLEAFGCGCPVLLSNSSSMPEVGGDAVVYINPKESKDIEKKVRQVITTPILRKELICKGKERLKHFTWDSVARQTVECYERVVNS